MIRQTVLGFKLERVEEELTAHGGLALMAEYHHGLKLRELADRYLPGPGSNRGYTPSVFVESLVLMLQWRKKFRRFEGLGARESAYEINGGGGDSRS